MDYGYAGNSNRGKGSRSARPQRMTAVLIRMPVVSVARATNKLVQTHPCTSTRMGTGGIDGLAWEDKAPAVHTANARVNSLQQDSMALKALVCLVRGQTKLNGSWTI